MLPMLFLFSAAHGRGTRYPLPPGAQLTGLHVEIDQKQNDAYECARFRLNAAQIRFRFRTYRELGPRDAHDHYAWYPCSVNGTILFGGQSYYFKANMANTLWTNWPDGKDKQLGGKHDGELSD